MKVQQIILLITVMVCMSACSTLLNFVQMPNQTVNQELIAEGIVIYRQNYCGSCHTLTIANTRGTFAPNHDDIALAEDYLALSSYTGNADTLEDYIRESIIDPSIFFTPGYEASSHHMPAFQHLADDDINAMVYMLMNQMDYQADAN